MNFAWIHKLYSGKKEELFPIDLRLKADEKDCTGLTRTHEYQQSKRQKQQIEI